MTQTYIDMLYEFHTLQQHLFDDINPSFILQEAIVAGYSFTPTQTTIAAQIQFWPKDIPLFPLGSWITPRTGNCRVHISEWEWSIHGTQDISFFSENKQDIVVTMTTTGQIGLTDWAIKRFLETLIDEYTSQTLLALHDTLFATVQDLEIIQPVLQRTFFEDPVFSLKDRSNICADSCL